VPGPSEDKKIDDDDAWLEVLAGRSVDTMDEASRQQAERVRGALMRRRVRVASAAPPLDEAAFERLLFRMKREGVDSGRLTSFVRQPSFIWGIAASIMLVAIFSFQQLSLRGGDDHLVLRGPNDMVLIDSDPSARLNTLRGVFSAVGATPDVKIQKDGTIIIAVAATPQVLDALGNERIYPVPSGGVIVLVIQKPGAQKP
jgi:hypothetical protein